MSTPAALTLPEKYRDRAVLRLYEIAALGFGSVPQIHRDVESGRLPVLRLGPRRTAATVQDVLRVYGARHEQEEAAARA
jgi:hypothetical protein